MMKMYGFFIGGKMKTCDQLSINKTEYELSRQINRRIRSFDVILNINKLEDGQYINFIKCYENSYIVPFSVRVNSKNSNEDFNRVLYNAIFHEDVNLIEWFLKVFKPRKNVEIITQAIHSSINMLELLKSYGYAEPFDADENKILLLEILKKIEKNDIVEWIFATFDFSNISTIIFNDSYQIGLKALQLLNDKKIHFSLTDKFVANAIAFKDKKRYCDLYTYLVEMDEITEDRVNLGEVIGQDSFAQFKNSEYEFKYENETSKFL